MIILFANFSRGLRLFKGVRLFQTLEYNSACCSLRTFPNQEYFIGIKIAIRNLAICLSISAYSFKL